VKEMKEERLYKQPPLSSALAVESNGDNVFVFGY